MPRVIWNQETGSPPAAIELHYGSPNEFLGDLGGERGKEDVFLNTDRSLGVGARCELHLHIGFIGRTLRLQARVLEEVSLAESRRTGRPAGIRLGLFGLDGSASADLRKVVEQLRQGLAYEAARPTETATGERPTRERQIRSMPTTLKIMLALKADREDRLVLANDPDPQVIQFLLKNTKVGVDEIRALTSRPSISHQHVVAILANPAWANDEQVRLNLARNPRLPDHCALALLQTLATNQLKVVAGSAGTSATARRIAFKLLYDRGQASSGGRWS